MIVGDEMFSGEQITWTVGGKIHRENELANHGDIQWGLVEPAILTIRKPSGLEQGFHNVEIKYAHSSSNMPPSMAELIACFERPNKQRLIMI